jgi:CBS domain-containing protein
MFAKLILTEDITPLKTSDSGAYALNWMEENKISHLPIVNNVEFLGLISDEDIFSLNNFEEALGNHKLSLPSLFVYEDQHLFEIIKIISEHKLTLVPVLDRKNRYLGSITTQTLTQSMSEIASVDMPGGVIVLELSNNDYSLSQIAQIVESNDSKILSLCVTSKTESTQIEVALKVNTMEIGAILQTFDRYNYYVKASYTENEDVDDLKDRFDSFMNYLNV